MSRYYVEGKYNEDGKIFIRDQYTEEVVTQVDDVPCAAAWLELHLEEE